MPHLAGLCLAAVLRLLPRRRRFAAALHIARAAEPLVRRTELYRLQAATRVDSAREIAAHLVLHSLTRNGLEFDPIIDVDGWDEFVRACREGHGVLLAAPHTALGLFLFRLFRDYELDAVTITGEPERIPGTRDFTPSLQPSPTFLVNVRTRLRQGRVVTTMLDRARHHGERTLEVETANGPVIVAPALLQVAARCGARVAFTEMHVGDGRLAGTVTMATSTTAEGLTQEFVEFLRTHVARRFEDAA